MDQRDAKIKADLKRLDLERKAAAATTTKHD
jgi:hypothetical protein